MAKKIVKKVDQKKVMKAEIKKQIERMLEDMVVKSSNGEDFGFTSGTLVAHMKECDVQIKLITPKAGIDRYESLVEEEEEEEEEEEIVEE